MKEAAILDDQATFKPTMLNGSRCSRNISLLLIIYIFIFSGVIIHLERSRWQSVLEMLKTVEKVASDQAATTARCQFGLNRSNEKATGNDDPFVIAITPTFTRPVQKAELTRLSQTFMNVPNFHWIIVEDSAKPTALVGKLLVESGLAYTHLNAPTPEEYKLKKNDPHWKKPRGVEQRNTALKWIRDNLDNDVKGAVYFADDDNTYSIKLFREIKKVKKVGVWPVGLVAGFMVEKPICDKATNKVVGFNATWKPQRTFPIDMAGFAINLKYIIDHKNATFSFDVPMGHQETTFLEHFVKRDELEPLADVCTKVYVWHTRTQPPDLGAERKLIEKGKRSDADIEV